MTIAEAIIKSGDHIALAIFLGFFWLSLLGNK